jgi:DNA-binding Lrp family transcriptional regulator
MEKQSSNSYYKVLNIIQRSGVNSIKHIAQILDLSEELLRIIIESLEGKGYLKIINENNFKKENSFACKFCPFANECASERLPSIFYELSQKGKNILKQYKMRG